MHLNTYIYLYIYLFTFVFIYLPIYLSLCMCIILFYDYLLFIQLTTGLVQWNHLVQWWLIINPIKSQIRPLIISLMLMLKSYQLICRSQDFPIVLVIFNRLLKAPTIYFFVRKITRIYPNEIANQIRKILGKSRDLSHIFSRYL